MEAAGDDRFRLGPYAQLLLDFVPIACVTQVQHLGTGVKASLRGEHSLQSSYDE